MLQALGNIRLTYLAFAYVSYEAYRTVHNVHNLILLRIPYELRNARRVGMYKHKVTITALPEHSRSA